jgi:hypothetical protein
MSFSSLFLISLAIVVSYVDAQNLSSTFVKMDYDGSIELLCPDSNPTWYLFNVTTKDTIKITDSANYKLDNRINALFIGNLKEDELNYAQYYCNTTDGSKHYFIPNTQPVMAASNDTKYTHSITEGGYIEILCQLVVGFNTNHSLTWNWTLTRENTETPELISLSNGYNFQILNSDTNVNYSRLIIRNVAGNMSGIITCTATNNIGSATEKVTLTIRSKFWAALPFFGVMTQVALASIIILLVEKKFSKKNRENQIEFVAESYTSKQTEKEEILKNRNAVAE